VTFGSVDRRSIQLSYGRSGYEGSDRGSDAVGDRIAAIAALAAVVIDRDLAPPAVGLAAVGHQLEDALEAASVRVRTTRPGGLMTRN
jgi:hypothetical protein